jgi:hypothetical protein
LVYEWLLYCWLMFSIFMYTSIHKNEPTNSDSVSIHCHCLEQSRMLTLHSWVHWIEQINKLNYRRKEKQRVSLIAIESKTSQHRQRRQHHQSPTHVRELFSLSMLTCWFTWAKRKIENADAEFDLYRLPNTFIIYVVRNESIRMMTSSLSIVFTCVFQPLSPRPTMNEPINVKIRLTRSLDDAQRNTMFIQWTTTIIL